jgi:hypothetical protein
MENIMTVDPKKPRTVLVIHGVQAGVDEEQKQHKTIKDLLQNRLGNIPLQFDTDIFRYEDLNDKAHQKYRKLIKLIIPTPFDTSLSEKVFDLIGDVVTAKQDTSTAAEIRNSFKEKILAIFENGNPCYIVAHSLGTIYAFDVINELIADKRFFNRTSRRNWPVQGLVTLGSPLGISMFKKARPKVSPLGEGTKWLRWLNYWDRNDPVVSGAIFGKTLNGYQITEKYLNASQKQGWVIRDIPVDTGKTWLLSHVAYWDNPIVGDGLVDLILN